MGTVVEFRPPVAKKPSRLRERHGWNLTHYDPALLRGPEPRVEPLELDVIAELTAMPTRRRQS